MMIYTKQKSKKRKPNAKERALAADWQKLLQKYTPKITHKKIQSEQFVAPKTFVRETNYIPSIDTGYYNTFKKPDMYYTGVNLKGIGALHKSNLVPILNSEQAKEQASMRR
jgi:hypothetical protein